MSADTPDIVARLRNAVDRRRLIDAAVALLEIPSPTRDCTAVADRLAGMLAADGFHVERPDGGWPSSPAVAVRYGEAGSGRTLQFNGHIDTVHLPFIAPHFDGAVLCGSGAADMKGGVAAMVEALRALRDAGLPESGAILLTAHDLHEAPWGDGSQLDGLIAAGLHGDGVLIPEYTHDVLPVIGRGQAVIEVTAGRTGEPVHEVLGGIDGPNVIAAGAALIHRLMQFDDELADRSHPVAGRESAFVGQVHAGEIFNQSPVELRLQGTRRWLPGTNIDEVRREFHDLLSEVEEELGSGRTAGVQIEGEFRPVRDAFELPENDELVRAFQSAHAAVSGAPLPTGRKPFVDDGNTFYAAGIPAITHGPAATGAHTTNERVPIAELERVALEYAISAAMYCRVDR